MVYPRTVADLAGYGGKPFVRNIILIYIRLSKLSVSDGVMAVKAFGIGSGIDTLAVNNMATCKIRIYSFRAPTEILVTVDTPVYPDKPGKVVAHRIISTGIHAAAAAPCSCQ